MTFSELQFKSYLKPDYAVIGHPIAHSLSPELHEEIFSSLNLEKSYLALDICPEDLPDFLAYARKSLSGFNVTIPYKHDILPFLDEVDSVASQLGAVNTVTVNNGRLVGSNTDMMGFSRAMNLHFPDYLHTKTALILGCGGFARVAALFLARAGLSVSIAARNWEKAHDFTSSLPFCEKMNIVSFPVEGHYDLVINCTPVGMNPYPADCPVPLDDLTDVKFIYDAIYHPLQTTLLKEAAARSIPHANGLSLLVGQALAAEEIWQKETFPSSLLPSLMDFLTVTLAKKHLKQYGKDNVILSGFMGSGKSTVGRKLAQKLGYSFLDIDEQIVNNTDLPIPEIFSTFGEGHFRLLERAASTLACAGEKTVIALGGGAILDEKVAEACLLGGAVIFLRGDIDFYLKNLGAGDGRPLANGKTPEKIEALYQSRLPFYESQCHFIVDAAKSPEEVALSILQII